jgi:hypothetical protein
MLVCERVNAYQSKSICFIFVAFNGAETVIDGMKESVKALMDMFRLPVETDFVIYRILKDYRGDFKLASSRLLEGTDIFVHYATACLIVESPSSSCFTNTFCFMYSSNRITVVGISSRSCEGGQPLLRLPLLLPARSSC